MSKIVVFIFLLCTCSLAGLAQQDKVIIRFYDAVTAAPLHPLILLNSKGDVLATADTVGYVALPFDAYKSLNGCIAIAAGYVPDTLTGPQSSISLQPLSVMLGTAIISGTKTKRLLNAPDDFVVDYDFTGDHIIAATYSGSHGGKARILLMSMSGVIQHECTVPDEPVGIFRSCTGNYYCICSNRFFLLGIDSSGIALLGAYPIQLLAGLQQCARSIHGNHYYCISDKNNFRVTYGLIAAGDTVFTSFKQFEEREIADASNNELMDILALMEQGEMNEAARRQALRKMWDNGSFAHINMPPYSCGDSIVLFDYFKKAILFYSLNGIPAGSGSINFDWRQFQQFSIIEDRAQNKLYIHRYGSKSRQTIALLNIATGTESGTRTVAGKPFAEDLKIWNGNIYFLWQDSRAGATRQLFIQHID